MSKPGELNDESMELAAAISHRLRNIHRTVAVAESLTSGSLASHLGAANASSEWFNGGIVAYAEEVKFSVLGVEPGPVVTAACARQMARGVAKLMNADFSIALTGVGGPDDTEGQPAGTVFFAVHSVDGDRVEEQHFVGEASQVVRATTLHALKMLDAEIASASF